METKTQEKPEIRQVEHLFFATINGNEVLFLKPKGETEARVYQLANGTFEKFFTEFNQRCE